MANPVKANWRAKVSPKLRKGLDSTAMAIATIMLKNTLKRNVDTGARSSSISITSRKYGVLVGVSRSVKAVKLEFGFDEEMVTGPRIRAWQRRHGWVRSEEPFRVGSDSTYLQKKGRSSPPPEGVKDEPYLLSFLSGGSVGSPFLRPNVDKYSKSFSPLGDFKKGYKNV
jgi:hypothetical protein